MKARHLILMVLNAWGGKIESKTKLHKIIYFISLLLGKDLKFQAHYYGPYSLEVEQGIDELVGAGFLNVKRDVLGINIKFGFEAKRYEFSLTKSGKKLAKTLKKENPDDSKTIRKFVKKLKEIGDPDYLSLSIAAKAYFILDKEEKAMTKDDIMTKASNFGWKVGEEDINVAVEILSELDFVEKG